MISKEIFVLQVQESYLYLHGDRKESCSPTNTSGLGKKGQAGCLSVVFFISLRLSMSPGQAVYAKFNRDYRKA